MEKVLIRQHLNSLSLVMNHVANDLKIRKDLIDVFAVDSSEAIQAEEHYQYCLEEALCDLDTIRQEYQKELDK